MGRSRRRGSSAASDPAYIARAVEQIAQFAEGLEEAHRQGLVHRDVKPSNILVDPCGRYVLVDFGLVHEEEAGTLTRSGEMVGTLRYMSPEQVARGPVDARSDVYSLGVTLFEVLTLHPPYRCESDHELQSAILFDEPTPPRRLNPRLNRDLETVLLRALEKKPERRYASAGKLAGDLRCILRYEPIEARPLPLWARLGRRAWRHRGKLGAAGLVLGLGLALAWMAWRAELQKRSSLIADYEPRVLRALAKLQLGSLSSGIDPSGLLLYGGLEAARPGEAADPIKEAVAELAQAAQILPRRPDAYYHRARGLMLLGRREEAIADLSRALAADPGFAPARSLQETLLARAGGFAEIRHRYRDRRVFDVLVEGTRVLASYDSRDLGFAVADVRELLVPVRDGALDIRFVRHALEPMISAIEVRRLEGTGAPLAPRRGSPHPVRLPAR